MKKSEAIQRLAELIRQQYNNQDYSTDQKDAREILDFLVKDLKMLPPSYLHIEEGSIFNHEEFNEWESE